MCQLITEQGPLKQLALPLLCDMAHNVGSRRVRDELWEHNTVEFYFTILSEHYWKIHALNSISMWCVWVYEMCACASHHRSHMSTDNPRDSIRSLQHDADRVQDVMLRPPNITAIITLFRTPQRSVFESLLAPLQSMIERSPELARSLGNSLFVAELVHRLEDNKAIVLTSLLKMLLCVFEASSRSWDMIVEYSLLAVVSRFARNNRMVVVQGIARRLLDSFKPVVIARVSSSLSWS